jgi:hypothetical protein
LRLVVDGDLCVVGEVHLVDRQEVLCLVVGQQFYQVGFDCFVAALSHIFSEEVVIGL